MILDLLWAYFVYFLFVGVPLAAFACGLLLRVKGHLDA